jgi:dTDP-4-amino-4,6-dideoxygalactose transaminase
MPDSTEDKSRSSTAASPYTKRDEFLPFSPPCIGEEEIAEVIDTLRSKWITTGPKTKRFEVEFRDFLGAPGALALNSCTAGLHTALVALGVGAGAEVITTPMTFAASANVIEHVGARTVFVDVEPDTLNIDPAKIERAITDRTAAIIVVHYTGHPADMKPIREIASRRGIHVIEDAAHALPASYRGERIGAASNFVAFSFYATKNLTTAEGGMLTGDPELIDRARVISLHGMSRDAWKRYEKGGSWQYEVVLPGFKYNMTDLQAAIGLQQLRKLEQMQMARRAVVAQYHEALRDESALELPEPRRNVEHAWHVYMIRLRIEMLRIDRAQFIRELTARNIGSSVHFIPVHLHPYYRDKYNLKPMDLPVAFTNHERQLSLPLHPQLSGQDVADVSEAVLDIVETFRR